jgi:membrane dipeptidase
MIFRLCLLSLLAAPCYAQSYKKLHKQAIVIDTHNDVLSSATMKGVSIEDDLTGRYHSDIQRFKKGGVDIQVFSVFSNERYGKGTAFAYANREIDSLYAIVNRNPADLMLVMNPAQLQQAMRRGKMGCMIGVEGGHMIEDNLTYLDSLYKRGARYLTLTWNNSTSWASSAADETAGKIPNAKKGLNDLGKQIVRRMNELGMMVDVSHIGEQTFWDVMKITTKPVIASHSCVHALCPHPRNLKDEQIKAIGKNGGVIQLNFYSGFIDSNYMRRKEAFLARHAQERDSLKAAGMTSYEIDDWVTMKYPQEADALRPSIGQLLDHLDYIVRLIGVQGVGLGSDFDGIESPPKELDDVTTFPLITKALLERGYKKKEVEKILGGNFIRVFKSNQGANR